MEECLFDGTTPVDQRKLQIITRLNKSGRRYLDEQGPECKAAGIALLSSVSDDLDCIYFHVRWLLSNIQVRKFLLAR